MRYPCFTLYSCDQVIKEELYDDAMGYIIVFVKFGKVFVQRFIYNYNDYTMKFLLYQLKITANIEIDSYYEPYYLSL